MSEILLVGARPDQVRAVAAIAHELGHTVETVSCAAEALELIGKRDFSVAAVEAADTDAEALRALEDEAGKRDLPLVSLPTGRNGAEADADRLALMRSEALLRGAFEAAPIGKTVLDDARRILRANRAFALLLDSKPDALLGTDITSLAVSDDRGKLAAALTRVAGGDLGPDDPDRSGFDVHLRSSSGSEVWTCAYLSSIDPAEVGAPLLMIQWVDLSPRRHAEQARAELQLEHVARAQAEATAERMHKLQMFTDALETASLDELLPELALRLAEQFDVQLAEVRVDGPDRAGPIVVRAAAGRVLSGEDDSELPTEAWQEMPLLIDGAARGRLRLVPSAEGTFAAADRSLLGDLADRAALSIGRAQLHEQEHRIAEILQRGLLPTELPEVPGVELTAHYDSAGDIGEVGGDWYDVFELRGARVGIVLGDVAGKGIPAASAMGQLRSVTRAFALGDGQTRAPGDVLTRLNRHQLALAAEDMFTVLYAIIDPERGNISWANAGHPPPLLQKGSGHGLYLEGGDGLIGIDDIVYGDLERPLSTRDALIFYTDGLVERRGESLDAGLERLARAVAGGPEEPQALCRHILTAMVPTDGTQYDDVTIVLARMATAARSLGSSPGGEHPGRG
ncbi:MAG TPA: SpoIIE family protein phosphatase [Solirubrobacteraceae bacterium]|jgi:PAS domain S-box-containing protein|nr:SpoIIE family protein phosphatase [Solirubrobacteraceae bacterium]